MEYSEAGQPGAALLRLRQATREQHEAVEASLGLAAPFSREHYMRVLEGFDAFLQTWEAQIASHVPTRLKRWTQEGFRHVDLQHDLLALGIGRASPARLNLPLSTRAAAMGSLYVIEGSALGARVIAPRLAREHGLHADNGGRYFAADPDRSASRWRDFRFLLDQEIVTPSAARQACAAAQATFAALLEVFAPLSQHDDARAA